MVLSSDWRTWPACACSALQDLARMWKISSEHVFNSITIKLLKDVSYPESGSCTEATRKILTATQPGSLFWRTPARLGHHLWPVVTSESGGTTSPSATLFMIIPAELLVPGDTQRRQQAVSEARHPHVEPGIALRVEQEADHRAALPADTAAFCASLVFLPFL